MTEISTQIIETDSRIKIPVAVVLRREIDRTKKWGYPTWNIEKVLTGNAIDEADGYPEESDTSDSITSFHGGLLLELYKDGSEGYWYNLLSEEPYLFVVCEGEQDAKQIEPVFITANQDEATGHLESDDIVLSVAMPEPIRDLLERYVVDHYEPAIKKKRKRRDWLDDSLYVNKPNEISGNSETKSAVQEPVSKP
ncbi:MAG: DUF3305 domain-containing protein [Acidiferrobacterales bacterium]|nr:DUF3305 domain-containing protein [Acidiferrobacterales bacterium]